MLLLSSSHYLVIFIFDAVTQTKNVFDRFLDLGRCITNPIRKLFDSLRIAIEGRRRDLAQLIGRHLLQDSPGLQYFHQSDQQPREATHTVIRPFPDEDTAGFGKQR